jgi:hypothetical protein
MLSVMPAADLDVDQALQLMEDGSTSQQAAQPLSEGLGSREGLKDLYGWFQEEQMALQRPQPVSKSLPPTQAAPAANPCLKLPEQVPQPQEPSGMPPIRPGKGASSCCTTVKH